MAVSSHPSPKPKAPTIEELEQEAHAEMQAASDSKALVGAVRSWFAKWTDRTKEASLPHGVTFHEYRVIKKMYEKILEAKGDGKFVKGPGWMRIIPRKDDDESLGEKMRNNGTVKFRNTGMDILDYLLNRYLPEIMSDQEQATRIRVFFADDLRIFPGEIG